MYRFLRFPDGKPKAVTLSYDDGSKLDIQLREIIDKYKIKCTFNISSRMLGDEFHLTADKVKTELFEKGHEIAVHGAHHMAPGQSRPIEGIQDVLECRKDLEKLLGCIVRGMAYPNCGITRMENGDSYENIRTYLKSLDIAYARTLGGDNDLFRLPTDWYAWMPTAHHNNPQIFEYIKKFTEFDPSKVYWGDRGARLFYLWGHSFEFGNDNSWDRLEKICEGLGGKTDTWYATNMEIYNYVNAYLSLVYSADGKTVYNPSLLTVWFETDSGVYSVKSGETITL